MSNDTTIVLNPGVGGDNTDATAANVGSVAVPLPPTLKRERVVVGADAVAPGQQLAAVLDFLQKNQVYVVPVNDFTLLNEIRPLLQDIRDYLSQLVRLQGGLE